MKTLKLTNTRGGQSDPTRNRENRVS